MKSRWKHEASFNLGQGFWKFEFRDDSYEPGDWCCIWTEHSVDVMGVENAHVDGHIQVIYYYENKQYRSYPAELSRHVAVMLERYVTFHTPALARLAECAD